MTAINPNTQKSQVKVNGTKSTCLVAEEIRKRYDEFVDLFTKYLPKVDPRLLMSLLGKHRENPNKLPMFTVEVFTKLGTDPIVASQMIQSKTGKVPGIYDNGTHYVTEQLLSLKILEEISTDPDVIAIKGDPLYGGASRGPSHEL